SGHVRGRISQPLAEHNRWCADECREHKGEHSDTPHYASEVVSGFSRTSAVRLKADTTRVRNVAYYRTRMDRRQLLTAFVGGLCGGLALPRRSAAQQNAVLSLSDRVSLVTSGKTNVLALATADGLVLVDSGAPELSDRLMESLRQLSTNGRAQTVFNTHWHPENTGANEM